MNPAIPLLALEVAASAAIQASGLGGPVALAVALAVVAATVVVLLISAHPRSPVKALRRFLAKRRATRTAADGTEEAREYDLDTIERYTYLHKSAVERFLRGLRERGIIGALEERRLNNPDTVHDLELLVDRLATYEAQL